MIAPVYKLGYFGSEMGMVISMLLGFAFGFVLERSGFGSPKKISAVWYGTDFAVIRVMFSALITAMVGLFGLHYLGLLDLSLVYINPTNLWPQFVGALIFGVGFAVGGFCPGTSAASAATGRIDAMIFLLGFVAGLGVFAESFPLVESFYNSSDLGRTLLSDWLGVPPGVVVFGITAIGIGAFYLLRIIETAVNKDRTLTRPQG